MEVKKLHKKAIKLWGMDLQVGMLMEEMAELTIAINKYRRKPNAISKALIIEEMEDVRIMLEQIEVIFHIPLKQRQAWRKHKLYKLEKLIKKEEKC